MISIEIDKERLMRRATYVSVLTASLLIGLKLVAWAMTGSVALLSTLMDSMLDAGASLINVWAVHHALRPADENHRFGHGKAEPLAGLAQAAFIVGSALFLVIESVDRLMRPQEVQHETIGIAVMVISIVATLLLVRYQKWVVQKTSSVAVKADSLHYTGDVLINASVIISIILSGTFGFYFIDPLFAIVIAGYLVFSAWSIICHSLDFLMDREFASEDRQKIIDICTSHSEVLGIHDLKTRSSGQQSFIQLHLDMKADISLFTAHQISDEVEMELKRAFPTAEIIIHQDPL